MGSMLLNDPTKPPNKKSLETALGKSFKVFDDLMKTITDRELLPEWNYYKDGKAWLCKVLHKKKTIFWLSIWNKYFKIAFYFTEKRGKEINELDIDVSIKEDFKQAKPVERLFPLVIEMRKKEQLEDALKIIEYKK